jgi:hypothetical protein
MNWSRNSLLLLVLVVSGGCGVTVKHNGWQEITARHPVGLENAVSTDEGAAFVEELGLYINKLEFELEKR